MMMRDGYSKELACGTIASTGTLGILVPPSIMLVMMGDRIGVSVGDLFLGAVFPGLMLAAFYVAYILIIGFTRADMAPVSDDAEPISMRVIFSALRAALPTAGLIIAVLGSIFMGIATPTEASGVGALGATLLAAMRGRLTLDVLRSVGRETTKTTAFIFALIICATAFSLVLRGLGGDELIERASPACHLALTAS